jgi:ribosomal protein S1
MSSLRVGMITTGTVVLVEDNRAFVQVGGKTEGIIYKEYYTKNHKEINSLTSVLKEGDSIRVEVMKVSDSQILLSRISIEEREKRDKLIRKIMTKRPFTASVKKVVEGGLILQKDDVNLFLPDNYVDLNREFDKATLVGTDTKVLFVRTEEDERGKTKFVVSRKQVQFSEERQRRQKEFDSINVDDIYEARVERLVSFGAFVKLNYCEGLIPLSEISHYHIKEASEILNVGDMVKVKVIKKTETKIQFSKKALEEKPWDIFAHEHKAGDVIPVKVVKKSDNFILCEAARDVVGILNKADYSWKKDDNYAGTVEIGDEINLQITYLDASKERMHLSKKHLEYNPWMDVKFSPHEIVLGTVLRFTNSGAIIKVGNVEGTLPDKEAFDGQKKAQEVLKEGEALSFEVLKCDPDRWQLILSLKSIEDKKNQEIIEKYMNENVSSSSSIGELIGEIKTEK